MAELVIIEVLPFTGPAPFKKIVKDLKPAVQNSVKPSIEKCISQADLGDQEMEDVSASTKTTTPAETKKNLPAALAAAKNPKNASIKTRPKTAAPMTAAKIHEKLNKKPMGLGGTKKGVEEEANLIILDVGKKEKRNEADKKKRWHPEEIRDDYVEKLKTMTKTIFGEATTTKMFSSDFKNHLKCLVLFRSVFQNEEIVDPFLEVLDIVIKWAYIKINEK
jgi:hypothetical protein